MKVDVCELCMEEVDPNKWREHMANKHHLVLNRIELVAVATPAEEPPANSAGVDAVVAPPTEQSTPLSSKVSAVRCPNCEKYLNVSLEVCQ